MHPEVAEDEQLGSGSAAPHEVPRTEGMPLNPDVPSPQTYVDIDCAVLVEMPAHGAMGWQHKYARGGFGCGDVGLGNRGLKTTQVPACHPA